MNRWRIVGCRWPILGWALALLLSLTAQAFAMSGREVYEKVHELRTRALDRETRATMTLHDRGGGTRSRTLVEYSKRGEAYKVLVLFESPPDLKDVGFLVHARSFADRDLWAYFPEFKRIRRIPDSSQDDSFFGTDFSYDDFGGPPNLDDYHFTILREETVEGLPCYVVEVEPRVHRKWSRYVSWVAKDLWVQVKIEYYQGKELYRQGVFSDLRIIDDIPTPFRGLMENVKTGHKTGLAIEEIRYHTRFDDELFTQRSLERAGR